MRVIPAKAGIHRPGPPLSPGRQGWGFSFPRVGRRPMETLSKVTSFPRKRESSSSRPCTPAFAGATRVGIFIPSDGPQAHGNSFETHVIPAKAGIHRLRPPLSRGRQGWRFSFPRVGRRPMETPSKVTSFPRKRESRFLAAMHPRFRGGDKGGDFHSLGWAAGPWKLRRNSRHSRESGNPPPSAPAFAGATRVAIFIPSGGPQAHGNSVETHVIAAKAGIHRLRPPLSRGRQGWGFSFPRVGRRPMETPSKLTSFPRKRESTAFGPRFRGGDKGGDFHSLGWAAGPWKLRRNSRHSRESGNPPAWAPAFAGVTRVGIPIPSGGPQAHGNSVESHVIPAKAGIQIPRGHAPPLSRG
jgi:hypothetical protein